VFVSESRASTRGSPSNVPPQGSSCRRPRTPSLPRTLTIDGRCC
jgi:hypothetical protein